MTDCPHCGASPMEDQAGEPRDWCECPGSRMRYALVSANAAATEQVAAYLPDNYRVLGRTPIRGTNTVQILIGGTDVAGWTLDDYVLPRLASGLYYGDEIA